MTYTFELPPDSLRGADVRRSAPVDIGFRATYSRYTGVNNVREQRRRLGTRCLGDLRQGHAIGSFRMGLVLDLY